MQTQNLRCGSHALDLTSFSKIVTFFPFNSLFLKMCNSILLSMVYAVWNVCSLWSLFNLCDYFESE